MCSLDIVKSLVAAGAELEAKTDDGSTALYIASYKGFHSIVTFLLGKPIYCPILARLNYLKIDSGSDVNTENNRAWSPLLVAAAKGHVQVAFVLSE